jgi:alanine dehydrogenase
VKISELQAILAKVATLAGDINVKLSHAESEAETEIKGLAVLVTGAEGVENSIVTIVHDTVAAGPVSAFDAA